MPQGVMVGLLDHLVITAWSDNRARGPDEDVVDQLTGEGPATTDMGDEKEGDKAPEGAAKK